MINLNPCPMCGSDKDQAIKATMHYVAPSCHTVYWIRCDACGFRIDGYAFEESAVDAWNRLEVKK